MRPVCAIQTCEELGVARGMCRVHYRAWRAGRMRGRPALRIGERRLNVAIALVEAESDEQHRAAMWAWRRLVRFEARRLVARWGTLRGRSW